MRLTVLMRDVLRDVNTAALQQLGLSQYVLLVFPGGETDNTRPRSIHFRSRVYPLHLQDQTGSGQTAGITNLQRVSSVSPAETKYRGKSSNVPSKFP